MNMAVAERPVRSKKVAPVQDGIHAMVPAEKMCEGARKLRATYALTPGAGFYQREFGYYSLDQWKQNEGMPADVPLDKLFQFDPPSRHNLGGLGWCEAGFSPKFDEKLVEDRGEYEVVQSHM